MQGIESISDVDLRRLLVDPMGRPTTLGPNGGFPEYLTREEAKVVQQAARAEFRRRGYSAAECASIELGDTSPIAVRNRDPKSTLRSGAIVDDASGTDLVSMPGRSLGLARRWRTAMASVRRRGPAERADRLP